MKKLIKIEEAENKKIVKVYQLNETLILVFDDHSFSWLESTACDEYISYIEDMKGTFHEIERNESLLLELGVLDEYDLADIEKTRLEKKKINDENNLKYKIQEFERLKKELGL